MTIINSYSVNLLKPAHTAWAEVIEAESDNATQLLEQAFNAFEEQKKRIKRMSSIFYSEDYTKTKFLNPIFHQNGDRITFLLHIFTTNRYLPIFLLILNTPIHWPFGFRRILI